jgi:3-hydroxyacyl-[acyl-carrier-protein] dehydratase
VSQVPDQAKLTLSTLAFMSIDLAHALTSLPHGPAFRFVDELQSLHPGLSASAIYHLPADAAFLAGHFPGRPLMPGVLMLEALAQVAGIAAQTHPEIPALIDLRLTALRFVKILGSISPGQTLHIKAEIEGRLGNLVQAKGNVSTADGTTLLEGQVTLSGTLSDPISSVEHHNPSVAGD